MLCTGCFFFVCTVFIFDIPASDFDFLVREIDIAIPSYLLINLRHGNRYSNGSTKESLLALHPSSHHIFLNGNRRGNRWSKKKTPRTV